MRRRNPQVTEDQQQRDLLLRPPDKTLKEKFRDLFWDPKKKTCLTRTPINWLSITIYYFIFLTIVIFLFLLTLFIVYFLVNVDRPQYVLKDSPIGSTPVLSVFPFDDEFSMIWLDSNRPYKSYVEKINKNLKDYNSTSSKSFNISDLGDCGKSPFGYDKKTPCIFFRMTRLLFWTPNPYRVDDDLPKDVPSDVKKLIGNSTSPKIWVSCNGSTPKDRDHMPEGFFEFQGTQGFDITAYPFHNQNGFIDPIIAMKLNFKEPEGTLFTFTCTAWGKEMDTKITAVHVNFFIE